MAFILILFCQFFFSASLSQLCLLVIHQYHWRKKNGNRYFSQELKYKSLYSLLEEEDVARKKSILQNIWTDEEKNIHCLSRNNQQ